MTAPTRQHPGLAHIDAVIEASNLRADSTRGFGEWEYRDGVCRSCQTEPARERRPAKTFTGKPAAWMQGECTGCELARQLAADLREREARGRDALFFLDTPPLYESADFDNFTQHGPPAAQALQARALQFARDYARDFSGAPPVSVFSGSPGTGKGHLAHAIAKAVAWEHGARAKVIVLSDLIRDLRESWRKNDDGPSEAERLERYRRLDLLVIDEVSKHALYGEPARHLYDLVAHREVYLRPTILTTNEGPASLSELLGPALVSRVAGWDACIEFGTTDYRTARGRLLREHRHEASEGRQTV